MSDQHEKIKDVLNFKVTVHGTEYSEKCIGLF
jgi:hypothetical protein